MVKSKGHGNILIIITSLSIFLFFFKSDINAQSNLKGSSQNYSYVLIERADSLISTGKYFEAEDSIIKAKKIFESANNWDGIIRSEILITINFWFQNKFSHADSTIKIALERVNSKLPENNELKSYIYNIISQIFLVKGDLQKAIFWSQKEIVVSQLIQPLDSVNIAIAHHNLGILYAKKMDFQSAHKHYDLAFKFKDQVISDRPDLFINWKLDLISLFLISNNAKKVRGNFREFESFKFIEATTEIKLYNSKGIYYILIGKPDSAILNLWISKIRSQSHNNYLLEHIYGNLASAYYLQDSLDKAEFYHKKSIEGFLNIYGAAYPELAKQYSNLGNVYSKQKRYPLALRQYQQVLVNMSQGFTDTSYLANPTLDQIRVHDQVLTALSRKSATLLRLYEENPSQEALHLKAFETYALAIDLVDRLRRSHISEGAKQFLIEERIGLYESAVATAVSLYHDTGEKAYLEKAFHFTEQSKAALLIESVRSFNYHPGYLEEVQSLGYTPDSLQTIPDSIARKEYELKRDVAFYEQKIWESELKHDSARVNLYQNYSFRKRDTLDQLSRYIKTYYPGYYRWKYEYSFSEASQIQQKLPRGTMLLEYMAGEEQSWLFVLTREKLEVHTLPQYQEWLPLVKDLRASLTSYKHVATGSRNSYQNFCRVSYQLYETLLKPALNHTGSEVDRLVIVPDRDLHYIPFEVLIRDNKPDKYYGYIDLPYLCQDYATSYMYSATLWLENQKFKPRQKSRGVIGFAPVSGVNSGTNIYREDEAAALPSSEEELVFVARHFRGKFFLNEAATKAAFLREAQNYSIIHLATHGIPDSVNPSASGLEFFPETSSAGSSRLFAYEISGLPLQADLAVLSACETGLGKYATGEGILSLARGFMASGTPNIIMSIWKVEDRSSAQLMGYFYEFLSQGMATDLALQKAKKKFLRESDAIGAHPFFWAGFVSMGNTTPVTGNKYVLIMLFILSGIIVAFFFFRYRNKISKKSYNEG